MPQGIPTRRYGDASVNAEKLTTALRTKRYVYERFDHQPAAQLLAGGYTDPHASNANRCLFRGGLWTQYYGKGTQTILAPVYDGALGLLITQDTDDNDGVEHIFGGIGVKGPFCVTVPDYLRVDLNMRITDVSQTDDCAFGFRKNEAAQANIDDFDEAAFINVISGDIKVETILNGATTVTTDSGENWADLATKTLSVRLNGRRVTCFVDDVLLPGIPEFNFDTGEVILPFFFNLNLNTGDTIHWQYFEGGLSEEFTSTGLAA